jgi:hypothetical protein
MLWEQWPSSMQPHFGQAIRFQKVSPRLALCRQRPRRHAGGDATDCGTAEIQLDDAATTTL